MDPEYLEYRLAAIEYLLVRVFAGMTRSVSDEQFERITANWLQGLDRQTFSGIDLALSDTAADEIRANVSRLLHEAKEARKMGR